MFDCPYCHAPFATYSALLNHKRDGHPAPGGTTWAGSMTCSLCGATVPIGSDLPGGGFTHTCAHIDGADS